MKVSEMRVMRKVERGFCHSFAMEKLGPREARTARALVERGWLRLMPSTVRFPWRYVTTQAGSWALGTFDSNDRHFYEDSKRASLAVRRAA